MIGKLIGKIKDFLYNFNDALVVLLIVALAAGILVWRVDEIMAYPEYLARQERTASHSDDVDFSGIDLTPEEVEDFNDDPDVIEAPLPGEESGTPDENGEDGGENSEAESGAQSLVTADTSFTVPAGSSADRIADLLVQAGLVPSQQEFLKAVTDNGLDKKLQAGTFTIPKGSTVLDIARIIARQR